MGYVELKRAGVKAPSFLGQDQLRIRWSGQKGTVPPIHEMGFANALPSRFPPIVASCDCRLVDPVGPILINRSSQHSYSNPVQLKTA